MNLELRHARVVARIADAGSISAAALALEVPQPSLTAQLRRIERMIGGELFVRSRTGVQPTPLGEQVIPMLHDVVERSEAVMALAGGGGPAVLALGVAETTPVALHREVERALPDVEVRTVTTSPELAVAGVERGSLTAALVSRPARVGADVERPARRGSRASSTVVDTQPVRLALPTPALAGPDQAPLAEMPWVLRPQDHWFAPVEAWLLPRIGVHDPVVVHRAATEAEVVSWVADASVAALVGPDAAARGVTVLAVEPAASTEWVLLHRRDALPRALLERLLRVLRRHGWRAVPGPA